MKVNEIELTHEEIEFIVDSIEDAENGMDIVYYMIVETWNAILGRFDKTFASVDSLNPSEYAIPEVQWIQINNAALQHARSIGLSPISVTNVGIEFVDKGPSNYTTKAIPVQSTDDILPPMAPIANR